MGGIKDPLAGVAVAHSELSARQLAAGAYGPALESMTTALRLAPGIDSLWAQFSDLIRYFNFRYPADPVRAFLSRALEHAAVDPGNLVRPITSIALSHPQGPLAEPLLLRMLEDVVIRDSGLERVITEARCTMLDAPLALPVMVAIAHQCFNTEYVFDESEEERSKVEALRDRILSAQTVPPHWYAAYAAYRPLLTLQAKDVPIDSLARRQIQEPTEEEGLAASIPRVSTAKGDVSEAVKAQYEENPYPRWVRSQTSFSVATLAQIVRELFPQAMVDAISKNPRILVAGCGTGQNAIITARRFAGASVLAVDLSLASLGYAKRKTRELGVDHIEYRQADILSVGAVEERFDLIECSGVLHHLDDPFEGWRVLASLLKPGGFMRVGLYSESGRKAVVRARELIAAEGFRPDAEGIRACRAAIRARRDDELLAKIVRNEDFYSTSGCRDLLFHVQEHRFGLPQIESMIGRLGLSFLGFEFPDSGATVERYRARFPADRYLLNLQNWDQLEREFPDTFARMYQFWLCSAGE
jgi:2-polyprenyl-3-methyl-5-hydroxy-6-metoxy-1,4-benzoquinol methylase